MAEELRPHVIWISALLVTIAVPPVRMVATTNSNKPHSRQKRLLWLTTDGRLALPPGTSLNINPTLSLPFVRHPPDGFMSSLSISLPFVINFDKLGLTDDQNPYGVLPPLLSRSMGRAAGALAADYVAQLLNSKRDKREIPKIPGGSIFQGGERALLYFILEGFLSNFGMDGKACLLRAICEVHGQKMENFGLVGEVVKLFLTASRSPFSHLLREYVDAEESGILDGECWKYYKDCSKSLFQTKEKNKYSEGSQNEHEQDTSSESNGTLTSCRNATGCTCEDYFKYLSKRVRRKESDSAQPQIQCSQVLVLIISSLVASECFILKRSIKDESVSDYLTERICWWNEVCKEEFQTQFRCKCPTWSFCRSPGKYYNAFCSVAETGYIWNQPAINWGISVDAV